MRKSGRMLALTAMLVTAIGLSACAGAAPGAARLLSSLTTADKPVVQTVAQVEPALALAPTAQGVVAGDLQAQLQELYAEANPSVVNIRVQGDLMGGMIPGMPDMPGMPGGGEMPDLDQLPEGLRPFLEPFLDQLNPRDDSQGDNDQDQEQDQPGEEMPMQPMNQALGSGFVWDEEGHIVTNNHVVGKADEIEVTFADGVAVPAELVGTDPDSDLAVIKVDPKGLDLQPITVADSTGARVGQFVVAIGNPFGLEGSMTFGIVSALGRTLPANGGTEGMFGGSSYTIPDIIQTDAPVNPGNSGGVLLDLEGQLIGVPTAIESSSGVSAGIGFAVPSVIVAKVVPELIKDGSFEHPYIGISGGTVNPDVAEAMDLPATQRGALVVTVAEDGPAAEAGLQPSEETVEIDGREVEVGGDIIIGIDGQPVKRFDDLVTYLARRGVVGKTVELRILRNGDEEKVSLTLGERPSPEDRAEAAQAQPEPAAPEPATPEQAAPAPGAPAPVAGGTWLGINGITLTRELNSLLDLSSRERGVLVVTVAPDSPADDAGLRGGDKSETLNDQEIMVGGDVIVALDGENIDSIEQLAETIRSKDAGDEIELIVLRDGEEETLTVTLAERPASQ
jgi:S1-C subfamily serine protease